MWQVGSKKKMEATASKKVCLCESCPHGTGQKVTSFDFTAEEFCGIAEREEETGRFVPGMITPRRHDEGSSLTKCRIYAAFEAYTQRKSKVTA
jgi:hypothetical protein